VPRTSVRGYQIGKFKIMQPGVFKTGYEIKHRIKQKLKKACKPFCVNNCRNNFSSIFRISRPDGNVLLELALVLPVLILVLAGIVQFGFILNAKTAVTAAAYEAARTATISDDPGSAAMAAAENYASSKLPGWRFGDRLNAVINIPGTAPGTEISVEVIYRVPVFFNRLQPFSEMGSGLDIRGISVMRIEEKE